MRRYLFITVAGLAGMASMVQAHASERITLRNGFEIRCNHHDQAGDRVRLYLSSGDDNYIEIATDDVAGVEIVADPPPPPIVAAPHVHDARLSTADLGEMLAKAGHQYNLDVDLLASVVKAESGGNAHAVSRAGARGLMQLMPGTASGLGVQDSFKPDQNVRGGSAYLDALLTHYNDNMALALAAYNAGPAAVDKYHGIPPYHETRAYVARVIHEFNRRVWAREAASRAAVVTAAASQGKSAH